MTEPNWNSLQERLSKLTLRQIRPIKKKWFDGCMGGASSKYEIVREMVSSMRYWWRNAEDGQSCVMQIVEEVASIDGGWKLEKKTQYYAIEFGKKEVTSG